MTGEVSPRPGLGLIQLQPEKEILGCAGSVQVFQEEGEEYISRPQRKALSAATALLRRDRIILSK